MRINGKQAREISVCEGLCQKRAESILSANGIGINEQCQNDCNVELEQQYRPVVDWQMRQRASFSKHVAAYKNG